MDLLAQPLSSEQSYFVASVAVLLVGAAYSRRRERAQLVGFGIAAAGGFLWAALRGPWFWGAIVISLAVVVPWLIWGRHPRRARAAVLARSPITIEVRRRIHRPEPEAERGILDFKRDAIRSTNDMNEVLNRMARLTNRQNKRMVRHTRRMQREHRRGSDVEKAHRLSGKAARDMHQHADDLDRLEARFRTARESMIDNSTAWLQRQPSGPELDEYRELLRHLANVAREGRRNIESYRGATAALRRQNIAQSVNRAADRLVEVLSQIIENVAATERFYRNQGQRRRKTETTKG